MHFRFACYRNPGSGSGPTSSGLGSPRPETGAREPRDVRVRVGPGTAARYLNALPGQLPRNRVRAHPLLLQLPGSRPNPCGEGIGLGTAGHSSIRHRLTAVAAQLCATGLCAYLSYPANATGYDFQASYPTVAAWPGRIAKLQG